MKLLIIQKLIYTNLHSIIYPGTMELIKAIEISLKNYVATTPHTFFGGVFRSHENLMKRRPRNPQEERIEICVNTGYDFYVVYIYPGVDTDSDEMDAVQDDVIDCLPVNIDKDGVIDQDTRVLGIRVPEEEDEDE